MKKTSLIAAIGALVVAVLSIVSFFLMDLKDEKEYLFATVTYLVVGLGFAALLFKKDNKLSFIPVLVFIAGLEVFSAIVVSAILAATGSSIGNDDYGTFGFIVLVYFVVSLIFASKNQKWAIISVIAILSLYALSAYEIFNAAYLMDIDRVMTILTGSQLLGIIVFIVYYSGLLCEDAPKVVEEKTEDETTEEEKDAE